MRFIIAGLACISLIVIIALTLVFYSISFARTDVQELTDGQVFIVKTGVEVIKFPLVHVHLYSLDQINAIKKQTEISGDNKGSLEKDISDLKKILMADIQQLADIKVDAATIDSLPYKNLVAKIAKDKSDYWEKVNKSFDSDKPDFYLKNLPATPICDEKTDADGNFKIQIPSQGDWVLEASAEDEGKADPYFWLFRLSKSSSTKEGGKLLLCNDNLVTTKSDNNIFTLLDEAQIANEKTKKYSLFSYK